MSLTFDMRTVRDNVAYTESGEGYQEVDAGDATEATRVCYVPWQDAQKFREAILARVSTATWAVGDPNHPVPAARSRFKLIDRPKNLVLEDFVYNSAYRYYLRRKDPEAHPRKTWLHAIKADVTGIGSAKLDSGTNKILFRDNTEPGPVSLKDGEGVARIVVTYKKLNYKIGVSDDVANFHHQSLSTRNFGPNPESTIAGSELCRYVSREFKPATDSFVIPTNQLMEAEGSRTFLGGSDITHDRSERPDPKVLIAEPMARVHYKAHIVYTWHMVPAIPWAAGQIMGCCNDFRWFDFQELARWLGPETSGRYASDVLYLYSEFSDPYSMVDGIEVRDIKYHMLYRRPGNNFVFRQDRVGVVDMIGLSPPAEYRGWCLAFRELLPATRPSDAADIGINLNPAYGHKPGNTINPYADLGSLFQINSLS